MSQQHNLEHLVCQLARLGREHEQVEVAVIQDEIGHRSFGPCLFVPAILEISPLGAVPGLPTTMAVVVIFFAVQWLTGQDHLWLPGFLARRRVAGGRLARGMDKVQPAARALDKVLRPRLQWAMRPFWSKVAAALCAAMALTVPMLELVPFASSAPFAAIALFGLALIARDGMAMILGFALAGAGLGLAAGTLIDR